VATCTGPVDSHKQSPGVRGVFEVYSRVRLKAPGMGVFYSTFQIRVGVWKEGFLNLRIMKVYVGCQCTDKQCELMGRRHPRAVNSPHEAAVQAHIAHALVLQKIWGNKVQRIPV
jgi:hypothetical protein